jgi:PAS domain S-box-containing protein
MMDLSGYVLETLRKGGEFVLYRGRQRGSPLAVLMLAPVAEHPAPASVRRLEHEYALAAELDPAWAAKPLALTRHEGRTILVLNDPGGQPMDRLLDRGQGRPLELHRCLRIAIGLAAAVGEVHRRGLVHNDIKPANVLVDDAGNVRLIRFGVASQLTHADQASVSPEIIAGTLAYMSPEQTGRMNRSIDGRSDLYSLGVTLYQMLTGTLPFLAADPLEWVHCHIARQPTPPSERVAIPAPLSHIAMKLLAKNAEERYQTASGLEADLRHCLTEWESHGRIDPFPLGIYDASDRLRIPEKLYGRQRESDALLAAFDRVVAQGTPELVLVSGYSGVGKSSLVHELQKRRVASRGLFASGKFDQYKGDIPYQTMAQAFQTLVRQILAKSGLEVAQWRSTLGAALGPNGQLVVNLIPELELIIGTQPPVPELPPRDAQNRFQIVFRRFLGVFATAEHPLALFLDDLQWLDAATLDLLEHLVTHSEVRHLLLVGAYRNNEVTPPHPLLRRLESIRKAGARVQDIVLAPLGLGDVGRLVADTLHCEPERVRPLAQLVQEKTGGNPFFAIQFFTALAEEGLLAFDPATRDWQWDINRIRAKSYTDNVVDLMTGKLKRLAATTQDALKHLACLGNAAEVATLALVHGQTEETMHTALRAAVRAGLILEQGGTCKFLHDRIQQAAYFLIPDEQRADIHLCIGRAQLASMTAEDLAEHLFDVASQLNRGAERLLDRDEKARVAAIDLNAGRKAKASAAYASARAYFSAGAVLLDETDWNSQYALTFSLWLERAECELLSGNFEAAKQLIADLLQRARSKIDRAAVYRLEVQFHVIRAENQQAVASALICARLFGIDLPAHPTWEQVQAEYEAVWQTLDGRAIESLIDLPIMVDPELRAAMEVLGNLVPAAYLTDVRFCCFQLCRMVKVSVQYGVTGASAQALGFLASLLGPVFHRYGDAHRLAELACEIVEKHGFAAYQARVSYTMGRTAFWTQSIDSAIDRMRATFRPAIETGDLTLACYSKFNFVAGLLLRNDALDAVWRESESALEFAREAKYAVDIIGTQQRFIAIMQGGADAPNFNGAQFDETAFEAQLTGDRMPLMICYDGILKLKTCFLAGAYDAALAAADRVKPLLSAAAGQIPLLDYFYYGALAVAARYENVSTHQQQKWLERLTEHLEQLREWAEAYPPTFADKHALVSAELARLEGREADAMRLYERAIQTARDGGFVQNEGLAHELAAGFYRGRGSATAAHAHLEDARACFARWGAHGKVKQLEQRYLNLRVERFPASVTSTIGTPVAQLDVETVVKASQVLSSEIVLSTLIETLMRIAVEHAGAERAQLILLRDDEPQVAAEATTGGGGVEVIQRRGVVTPFALPESVLHYVIRTRESVILDDATAANVFSADPYVQQRRPRSVLCLPLVKQAKLVGALYLENNLTPRAFTSGRIAVLEMLASQAAISLENATLYFDLQRENTDRKRAQEELRLSEAFLAEGQRISRTGSWAWNASTGKLVLSEEHCRIFGFDPREVEPTFELLSERAHPEDRSLFRSTVDAAIRDRRGFALEFRIAFPDGSRKVLHAVGHPILNEAGGIDDYIGATMDITERKRGEEALRNAQADIARAARLTTMGELAASIAHEINQPLTGVVNSANACLRWLRNDEPNLEGARGAAERIVRDGQRAGEIIRSLRSLVTKSGPQMTQLDINQAIREILVLIRGEFHQHDVSLETALADGLEPIMGDRVQLQQVILNLLMNGIEAMNAVMHQPRVLRVISQISAPGTLLIAIEDSGPGLAPEAVDRLFEPFFTTKGSGMGMGLSICRSIVEAHGGRLWASHRLPRGAAFQFTLPVATKAVPD